MAELTLNINGRPFGLSCDDGQEDRVMQLAAYVDERLKQIASAGGAHSESHLLVLTSLMLADEIFDLRDEIKDISQLAQNAELASKDEAIIVNAIETLTKKITAINERVQAA